MTDWLNLLMVSIPDIEEIARNSRWKVEKNFEGENANYTVVLAKVS